MSISGDVDAYWNSVYEQGASNQYADEARMEDMERNLPIDDPMELFPDWLVDNFDHKKDDDWHYESFQDWATEHGYAYETNYVFRWLVVRITDNRKAYYDKIHKEVFGL